MCTAVCVCVCVLLCVCVKTNFISHSIKLILTPFAGGRTTEAAAAADEAEVVDEAGVRDGADAVEAAANGTAGYADAGVAVAVAVAACQRYVFRISLQSGGVNGFISLPYCLPTPATDRSSAGGSREL